MTELIKEIDGWTVTTELGSGDFASVYRVVATDALSRDEESQHYALKICLTNNRTAGERLERERAALERLDHPSIPRLVATGSYESRPYIVMTLARGKMLKAIVEEADERAGAVQGDLWAAEVLCELLMAVAHVHGNGLVHRDIKDANVLATTSGSDVILIDFGFCKDAGRSEIITSDSFFRVGAARFSPPSKLSNPGTAIEAHDVFAIGVIGYRLLTGDYPWAVTEDEDVGALRALQLSSRLVAVNERNPRVRPPVSQLIGKLLRIRDEDRPSAEEALTEMRSVVTLLKSPESRHTSKPRLSYPHVTRDPIHGDVRLTDYELRVLNTPQMQRLRSIRQLGLTNFVYTGAEHSRLAHSIGCLARTEQILRAMEDRDGTPIDEQFRLISRLYALTHDVTHIPFGHTLEDEFNFFPRHDANPPRTSRLIFDKSSELGRTLSEHEIGREVRRLLDAEAAAGSGRAVLDLVSGLTGADVLDYIDRDATYCGLDHRVDSAIFRQFQLQSLRNEEQPRVVSMWWGRYGLRIDRQEAVEAVVYERYKMFSKVYTHRTKIRASALLAKGLSEMIQPVGSKRPSLREEDLEQLGVSDSVILDRMSKSRKPTAEHVARQLIDRRLPAPVYRATLLGDRNEWTQPRYADRQHWQKEQGLLDPVHRASIEAEIAVEAHLRPQDIMIYCPGRAPGHKKVEYWATRSRDESPAQSNYGEEVARRHLGLWQMWVFVSDTLPEARRRQVGDLAQDRFGLRNDVAYREERLW